MSNGLKKPAHMYVKVEDRQSMVGQYIRHTETKEIFQIKAAGRHGVTAKQAEGFGGNTFGEAVFITWNSLKYSHMFMVHVADIDAKGDQLQ